MVNRPDLRSFCPFNPYSLSPPMQSDQFEIIKRTQPENCNLGNIDEMASIRERMVDKEIELKIRNIHSILFDQISDLNNLISQKRSIGKHKKDLTSKDDQAHDNNGEFACSNTVRTSIEIEPCNESNKDLSVVPNAVLVHKVEQKGNSVIENHQNIQNPANHQLEIQPGKKMKVGEPIDKMNDIQFSDKIMEQKGSDTEQYSYIENNHFIRSKNVDFHEIVRDLDEFFNCYHQFDMKPPLNIADLKMSYFKKRLMCKQGRLQERVFRGFNEQHHLRKIIINPLYLPEIRKISNFSECYVLKEIENEYNKKLEFMAIERRKDLHNNFKECTRAWFIDKEQKREDAHGDNIDTTDIGGNQENKHGSPEITPSREELPNNLHSNVNINESKETVVNHEPRKNFNSTSNLTEHILDIPTCPDPASTINTIEMYNIENMQHNLDLDINDIAQKKIEVQSTGEMPQDGIDQGKNNSIREETKDQTRDKLPQKDSKDQAKNKLQQGIQTAVTQEYPKIHAKMPNKMPQQYIKPLDYKPSQSKEQVAERTLKEPIGALTVSGGDFCLNADAIANQEFQTGTKTVPEGKQKKGRRPYKRRKTNG